MSSQQPDETAARGTAARDQELREQQVLAVLPRLTQLGNVLNRGRLVERAMEATALRLDRPAMSVLLMLHMSDQPLRVGEIATRMQVVGPHVTRQVNTLQRLGLIVRVTDPEDQRARLVEATDEGKAAAERYMGTLVGWFADALAGWPEQDRRDLGRLLGRFTDDLTAHLATLDDPTDSEG
ncbi:MarR family transcriptional regulator [Streptomyces tubbatahanensis]|uniref:MarR family transcriptional regulator n=1 Tax=Streptomyces tubbatahanensis TaxID=2923272 RepID=A0ABY3Y165_9ACTN|nr:MarR family transcriptional regulator [Streptomyces tubbatahanensis]UNT00575.1 MarR family transcriptional regulator [Streptomyces tubbatahanensis]